MPPFAQHLRPLLGDQHTRVTAAPMRNLPICSRVGGCQEGGPETLPLPVLEPEELGTKGQEQPADHQDKLLKVPTQVLI